MPGAPSTAARHRAGSFPAGALYVLQRALVLLLLCYGNPYALVRAWITIDNGQNVTIHGETNIGPYTTTTKYDLNVYGDTNVGGVNVITTSTTDSRYNVFVDGSLAALQLIFTDTRLSESEYLVLNTTWDTTSPGDESLSVSFSKYVLSTDGNDVAYDMLTITGGNGVNNDLDTNVTVDGKNAYLTVQSDYGYSSLLTLQELGEDDVSVESAIYFQQFAGELIVSGTTFKPMMSLADNRTDLTGDLSTSDLALEDYYDKNALTSIGITSYGATFFNVTAADYRSIYGDGTSEFLSSVGLVKAAITLSHSQETELMISSESTENYDQVKFSNGTADVIIIEWDDIILQPQYSEGSVYVGKYASGTGQDEVFDGANLAVARLNFQHLKGVTSKHIAYHDTSGDEIAVMEVNSYGDCAITPTSSDCSYNYPLYLASYEYIKAQTPYFLIGDGDSQYSDDLDLDPYNGAIALNRSGIVQTEADEELVLYSTHGSDFNGGVALEGAYRFQVNNITIVDYGGSLYEDSAKTPRYLWSEGSLRITTNKDAGVNRIPEVYIDGNEDPQVYLRVGTAVLRDGFLEDDTILEGITLLGVGTSADSSSWAPTESDSYDAVPAGNAHSGLLVLRSETEVRVDNEALFRIGDPYNCDDENTCVRPTVWRDAHPGSWGSILFNASQLSIFGDSEARPFLLKGSLGVEIGSIDAGAVTGGRLSRLERVLQGDDADTDDKSAFPGGRPLLVARDVEIDGCSKPCIETDGICYTSTPIDSDTETLYATRDASEVGYTGATCVSRIGILRTPPSETDSEIGNYDSADVLSKVYDESTSSPYLTLSTTTTASVREPKELYITSANYIDIDSRSRLKMGGLFFDGVGWDTDEVDNVFTEMYNFATEGQYDNRTTGTAKNTIQGDSGLNLNAGVKSGDLTIMAGSSRVDNTAAGDLFMSSGGTGYDSGFVGWNGDSGNTDILTANAGYTGNSGDISIGTGNAPEGYTGDLFLYTGNAETIGDSGELLLSTGSSADQSGGSIVFSVGDSGGGTGGTVYVTGGNTTAKDEYGGDVNFIAGHSSAYSAGKGGHINLTAGSSLCVDCGSASFGHGGHVYITGGYSQAQQGGAVYITTGISDGDLDNNKGVIGDGTNYVGSGELIIKSADGIQRSGNVTIASGDSSNLVSGSVNIYSGDGDVANSDGSAGDINIYTGDSYELGSMLNMFGGDAVATEGDLNPMGGNIRLKGGRPY
jgi:hypothetical protein